MALPGLHPMEERNRDAKLLARIAALEKRLATVERENRLLITTTGAVTGGRDGSMVGTSDTPRLYLRVNGTWRYTALT